jgi:hypothetical protein
MSLFGAHRPPAWFCEPSHVTIGDRPTRAGILARVNDDNDASILANQSDQEAVSP